MIKRNQLIDIFKEGVAAVQPSSLIKKNIYTDKNNLFISGNSIGLSSINKLFVIAAGKAASSMAGQVELQCGNLVTEGFCITKYGHQVPLKKFTTIEAAHPVPDENSIRAGEGVLRMLHNLDANDIVLVLLSGGASSLLADLPEGCSLKELQETFEILVNCGASIHEINIVRKHLSKIKGGQLARAAQPAKVYTLILSDVVGDDLSSIASGPTVADESTFNDAFGVLNKYNAWALIPENIRQHISKGLHHDIPDTPKGSELFFKNTFTKIIGNNHLALLAAKEKAEKFGYHTTIQTENLTGNTELLARSFIHKLIRYKGDMPCCFLLGGEPTLKVTGSGKGGRNQHFVLCALDELNKQINSLQNCSITILSAGTDGTDGPTDAAGAIADTNMLNTGLVNKKLIHEHLVKFDAYHFFEKINGLIKTGPTQTNVMDIIIALVDKKK